MKGLGYYVFLAVVAIGVMLFWWPRGCRYAYKSEVDSLESRIDVLEERMVTS